jgi:hypothetical protein
MQGLLSRGLLTKQQAPKIFSNIPLLLSHHSDLLKVRGDLWRGDAARAHC